ERLVDARGQHRGVADLGQRVLEHHAHRRLVVDAQDRGHPVAPRPSRWGSRPDVPGSDQGPGVGLHNGWLKRGANLADSRDIVTREGPMRISNQMLQYDALRNMRSRLEELA